MTLEFKQFDTRNYPTVRAREGYDEWVASYEESVIDEMDQRLLSRLTSVQWSSVGRAADLGCGTGRTGQWLKKQGVRQVAGVDIAPAMIERAKARQAHDMLRVGDVLATGLEEGAFDLTIACLVDEHVRDLQGMYAEANRLLRPGGQFVLVGYHPQFIMTTGMPTHFHRPTGEAVAIETYVHLLSDHITAGLRVGLTLAEMQERLVDETFVAQKAKWKNRLGYPFSFAMVWRRSEQ